MYIQGLFRCPHRNIGKTKEKSNCHVIKNEFGSFIELYIAKHKENR